MAIPIKEDELGKRWDRCIADGLLKVGGGVLVGAVSSLIIFKRRSWPIITGTGFGLGLAYGNCERQLRDVLTPSTSSVQQKA
ncbi:UPF0327 protein C1orf151-like [Nesidiocoris tenuis]|uniref:MICOS complex subunit MIC10 n=1 Tax=Nesidiocoris tenuis TaxID=355587 RepID=A0ABN7AY07_9HEMI|nr:UPF0327 protein C1orf151-like [Nesidiocoris tenuis]